MDGDCPVRTRDEHLELLRTHFDDEAHLLFPDNPEVYDWKFGPDGSGELDLLESAGIPLVVRRGSYVLYLGNAAHVVPPEDALFDYGPINVDADDSSDGGSHHSAESDDGEHAPDAPDALAPPDGQDMWIIKVEDVLSIQHADGLWRTYVVGTTFVTRSFLLAKYPEKILQRLEPVLSVLHPRQHVKTDLWDVARAHNLVGEADLWSLAPGAVILPPPVGPITTFRMWIYPGCVVNLADDVRDVSHKAAVLRGGDIFGRCVCKRHGCGQEYMPDSDVLAFCTRCGDDAGSMPWFHERCARRAPTPARLINLRVELYGGPDELEAPPVRRAPSQGPKVWIMAPRGIRVRVDCPVRSWERISMAVRQADLEARDRYKDEEEFMHLVASYAAQNDQPDAGWREMPAHEIEPALLMETTAEDGFRLLYCPQCGDVM